MIRYLFYDLRLKLLSIKFWLIIILYVILAFIPIIPELEFFLGSISGEQTYPVTYFWFIPYTQTPVIWVVLMTVAGFVTSSLVYDDLKQGYIQFMIYRTGLKQYLLLRLVTTIILAMVFSLIANLLILMLLGIWFPFGLDDPDMLSYFVADFSFEEAISLASPLWFYISQLLVLSLHTAWYAVLVVGVSVRIKQSLLLKLLPVFVYSLLNSFEVMKWLPVALNPSKVFSNRAYLERILTNYSSGINMLFNSLLYRLLFLLLLVIGAYSGMLLYLEKNYRIRKGV